MALLMSLCAACARAPHPQSPPATSVTSEEESARAWDSIDRGHWTARSATLPSDGPAAASTATSTAPSTGSSAPASSVGIVVDVTPKPSKPKSVLLRSGLFSPIPGGTMAGYGGDTGLDIASPARPVYAIAAGKLDYSEAGHTRWVGKLDTANCVRIELDTPIPWKKGKHKITHLYYAHLSALERVQKEGQKPRAHVEGGEQIGISGIANGLPHLHLGLLLDGEVEQDDWTYILREAEVREALGDYKNGEVLPKLPTP